MSMIHRAPFVKRNVKTMQSEPVHPRLKLLLESWQTAGTAETGRASLASEIGRDIAFFNSLLQDSFVARGPATGPFTLSFVGTSLEAHFGRKMSGMALALCFGTKLGQTLDTQFVRTIASHQPLLVTLRIRSQGWQQAKAEILCLPDWSAEQGADSADSTIFAAWAIIGSEELPPDPRPFDLAIESILNLKGALSKVWDA